MNGLVGKKVGMTQVFEEGTGVQIPVTVLEVGPCEVTQVKTKATDGYESAQVSFIAQKEQRLNSAEKGHFKKAGAAPAKLLKEFATEEGEEVTAGSKFDVTVFEDVKFVDVSATGKGRGFQGVVKRWNFGGGRKSHGGHALRGGGSIGQCTSPARVMKGMKMSGQMGNKRITVQNLKVIKVMAEDNCLLVKGAVPGPNGGIVEIRKAIKKS